MDKSQIILELQKIGREVFDLDELELEETTTADQVEEWDSMNHIKWIVQIEKHFKLKFDLAELRDIETVGGFAELIESKKNQVA